MAFKLHNTLTRQLAELRPGEPGHVRFYTCGPTVYNFAHIGNFRAYIFEDLLRRYLKFRGFRVTQVMNLTDVDDKTIRSSREQGLPLRQFTKKYIDAFFEDLAVLRVERAEHYPAATDHVPEMIALIQTLLDKGVGYKSDDGSIYFSIAKFPSYGKLAHLDMTGLRSGARVAQDEYEKESAADFALWKAWDEKDGAVVWDAPWGRGRPGWHIECSAMSMKYLGQSFDLHTGGVDNIFPHHEDEIAQSEAATGQPFVKYWMHCAHLVVDGKKMSKSLGNFFTLRDLLDKGYSGREIRYELLATHYRQSLNFTFTALDAARAALGRLDEFSDRLRTIAGVADPDHHLPAWAQQALDAFTAALDEDLNISAALAALFDMITAGNRAMNEKTLNAAGASTVLGLLKRFDSVLGFLQPEQQQADADALALLEQRQAARKAKNWPESDRIRDELKKRGWVIQDTAQGPKLKKM
ncbi:MAG: cysteine--tRNA ligase [Verrucomicrobia bacterium]|nr:MAG: cysteine--tRNA ligase [Verrucomicrobiota bacterium]